MGNGEFHAEGRVTLRRLGIPSSGKWKYSQLLHATETRVQRLDLVALNPFSPKVKMLTYSSFNVNSDNLVVHQYIGKLMIFSILSTCLFDNVSVLNWEITF